MEDTPSINGWKPPVVYDIAEDMSRIATQDDIDKMVRQIRLLTECFLATRGAVEIVSKAYRHQPDAGSNTGENP